MRLENFKNCKLNLSMFSPIFAFVLLVFSSVGANAQTIPVATVTVGTAVGNITSLQTLLIFVANFFKYIGWAGVVIGVLAVIALLIYKLIAADDTETMKKVQGGITKAVIIVILGLLLLGAGLLMAMVAQLVGYNTASIPNGALTPI
jgi:hypothetical protein